MSETKPIIKLIERSLFGNSPAQNSEAEDIMWQFAQQAAKTGVWPSIPLEDLIAEHPADRMSFESPAREGVVNLVTLGLATKSVVDGKEVLTLTDRFKNYYEHLSG